MEIRKGFLLLFAFILIFSHSIFSSEKNRKKDSSIAEQDGKISGNVQNVNHSDDANIAVEDEDAEENWQFLEWEEEEPEFVLNYEVIVECLNESEKQYFELRRLKTESNVTKIQINPLLEPGFYRYKIITYNLIGLAEVESDWFEFEIKKAFRPEINDISSAVSRSSTIFLEEMNNGIFNISGKNLFKVRESPDDTVFTSYVLESQKKLNPIHLVPKILEYDDRYRHLKIQFDINELETGTYNLVATDASGLKSMLDKKNEITVKFKKRFDFDVSGGYTCPVILYDNTINEYLGSKIWPLSLAARMSFIPFKESFGYFGLGFTGSYTRMAASFAGYDIEGNLITGHVLAVYQIPIRKRIKNSAHTRHVMTLELHGGAGITAFSELKFLFPHGIESPVLNSTNLSVLAGGAVQLYLTNRLYSEVALDYISAFISDMAFGMIEPQLSIGWQF